MDFWAPCKSIFSFLGLSVTAGHIILEAESYSQTGYDWSEVYWSTLLLGRSYEDQSRICTRNGAEERVHFKTLTKIWALFSDRLELCCREICENWQTNKRHGGFKQARLFTVSESGLKRHSSVNIQSQTNSTLCVPERFAYHPPPSTSQAYSQIVWCWKIKTFKHWKKISVVNDSLHISINCVNLTALKIVLSSLR